MGVPKGQRRINMIEFLEAMDLIAQRKSVTPDGVFRALTQSTGPLLLGTATRAVRLHDDKSTYTGVHVHGGPEAIKGYGTSMLSASAGMRHVQKARVCSEFAHEE